MHIVQIGCHVGNDSVFSLIEHKEEQIKKALIVDALPSSVDICKNFYKNKVKNETFEKLTFLKKAIVSRGEIKEVDFFVTRNEHDDDNQVGYTAFSSTNINHLRAHGVQNIKKISVTSTTLSALFNKHSMTRIDRLFLDAEGLDAEILLSLDFKKFDIPFICYESSHTDGAFQRGTNTYKLFDKFKENGYKIYTFLHYAGNYGYTQDQYDWNCWALKDGEEEYNDMTEYSGHKEKLELGHSKIVEI